MMVTGNRIRTVLAFAVAAMAVVALTTASASADATDLISALTALEDHIDGTTPLSSGEIETHKLTIDANKNRFDDSSAIITACFGLVETYDNVIGPMFVSGSPVQSLAEAAHLTPILTGRSIMSCNTLLIIVTQQELSQVIRL